MTKVKLRFLL